VKGEGWTSSKPFETDKGRRTARETKFGRSREGGWLPSSWNLRNEKVKALVRLNWHPSHQRGKKTKKKTRMRMFCVGNRGRKGRLSSGAVGGGREGTCGETASSFDQNGYLHSAIRMGGGQRELWDRSRGILGPDRVSWVTKACLELLL